MLQYIGNISSLVSMQCSHCAYIKVKLILPSTHHLFCHTINCKHCSYLSCKHSRLLGFASSVLFEQVQECITAYNMYYKTHSHSNHCVGGGLAQQLLSRLNQCDISACVRYVWLFKGKTTFHYSLKVSWIWQDIFPN